MRGIMTVVAMLVLVFGSFACQKSGGSTDAASRVQNGEEASAAMPGAASTDDVSVEKAAAIAREIDADPDQAEAILAKHGMTTDEFEDLMFKIASDPELSQAYSQAIE